mmetsp:Transcript_49799/g.125440  ORF Transcript_49799/g.125440 Transcript_49799/m.125440 type:complete len:956 (+) Transcript_49799:40-2907(+)
MRLHIGRSLLSAVALVAAVPGGVAFEPLPWDEAYAKAEETLGRMTEPLLLVKGACRRQSFWDGGLFQQHGTTQSGAPYFGFAGYFLYFDPHCDGNAETPPRWVLAAGPPSLNRSNDLDNDGSCSTLEAHAASDNTSSPPMGTEQEWQMLCDDSGNFSSVNLTLQMVPEGEKLSLLRGVGWWHPENGWYTLKKWWYVGNTVAIPRLNVPSLNMQDAAAGFRPTWAEVSGSETVWPSLLSMAATWDPVVVREFAEALGREFKQKGANAILGPSVNVHRVARNGRNFEYLSGEDPFLGSQLVKAYVQGIQSQGVIAVMKHWVFNQQETNRGSENSIVDDKTAWELYYPPFQAAVDAGVSAAMCSYNKVDGIYSCSNGKQLQILREKMGFKGFVQSDWWATHSTSVHAGLDQEMPGIGSGRFQHEAFFSADRLEAADQEAVDEAAKRILAAIYRMNISDDTQCTPPHCKDWFLKNVSTPAHVSLARSAAAKSVVLLQNEHAVLPLTASRVSTIAIIGAAANASSFDPNGQGQGYGDWATGDYYSGGGSGHMQGAVVTPLDGLAQRAQELGINVIVSATNDATAGAAAARSADIAIVVAGTTSGESRDRPDLHLDQGADNLIEAVQEAAVRTVVLVQAPGAVVMPWRSSVDGILIMFLGGQETGNAWSDIVFGDQVPTGRLPIMLPETEGDSIPVETEEMITYSEGMNTSYRSDGFRAAYPFGHGLTYTTFEYSSPINVSMCGQTEACKFRVHVNVKNTGNRTAPTIVQLYLQSPAEACHPKPLLKGFQKTADVEPNATEEVAFELMERDLSYYDAVGARWVMANGTFVAHVGESSADIRQAENLCVDGDCPSEVTPTSVADNSSASNTSSTVSNSSAMSNSSAAGNASAMSNASAASHHEQPEAHRTTSTSLDIALLALILLLTLGALALAVVLVQRRRRSGKSPGISSGQAACSNGHV